MSVLAAKGGKASTDSAGGTDNKGGDTTAAGAAAAGGTGDKAAADKAAADKAAADAAAAAGDKGGQGGDEFKAPATKEELQALIDAQLEAERAKFKAPDKYELPKDGPLGEADLAALTTEAKALGLTQAQAKQFVEQRAAAIDAVANTDYEELKNDPKIGGDKLPETEQLAEKGLAWFLSHADADEAAAINALLVTSGKGNYKGLVRIFRAIGQLQAEDNPALRAKGAGDGDAKRDHVDVLYPGQ
jgi:hypothetical protein